MSAPSTARSFDVDYVFAKVDGTLRFGIDEPGEHELVPRFGEVFTHPEYGILTFERDSAGVVTGFSLDAGRVRDLAFERRSTTVP